MLNTKPRIITQNERGMALIFVVVMLTAAFIGGMAAVGLTNGYLSRSRGFRTQAAVQACAEAGMAQMHSLLPDIADFAATDGQINIGGPTLSYRAGHYNKDGPSPFEVLDPQEYDAASLFVGENITNSLGVGASNDLSTGIHVIRMTTVCGGAGHGRREVETIFRYGLPVGGR